MSTPDGRPWPLTMVVAKLTDPQVGGVLAAIQDWSAVDIVHRSIWVDVDGDLTDGWIVDGGRIRTVSLVAWLARHPAPVRLVTLQVIAGPPDAMGVEAKQRVERTLQLRLGPSSVNLLAPSDGVDGIPTTAVFDSHINVLLQPVDAATPGSPTEPLHADSPTFSMHIAAGLATTCGLWGVMDDAPLDREQSWPGTQVAAARSFVRTLDTSDVLENIGKQVFGFDGKLPLSRTRDGEPAPLIPVAAQLAAAEDAGRSLLAKHADVTAFHPPPAFVPPKATGLSFGQAVRMFLSFLAKAVLGAPRAWVQNLVDTARRRIETTTTQALFGPNGQFQVVLGGGGSGNARTTDQLDHAAQSVLGRLPQGSIPPPIGVPELWQDAMRTSAALVDGGAAPDGIALPKSATGAPVIDDPDKIAPRPNAPGLRMPDEAEGFGEVREIRPDDPYLALQVHHQLEHQQQQMSPTETLGQGGRVIALQRAAATLIAWVDRQRSFTWTVGVGIALELETAGHVLAGMLKPADLLTPQDMAAPLNQQRKARRGVLLWLGLFILAIVAVVVTAVLAVIAWPILLAIATVVLVAIAFGAIKSFAYNQRLLFQMINRLEIEAQRRRWIDANIAHVSQEVVRLASVYRQSRYWLAIIGENVHDPFGGAGTARDDVGVPQRLAGELPLSVTLASARYSPETHQAALYRARGMLLRPGWLARQYERRRDQVLADLQRRTDRDLENRLWTDAAVQDGGPVSCYLEGLRDPALRVSARTSAMTALVSAVSEAGLQDRLLPVVTVQAGSTTSSGTWSQMAADLCDATAQLSNGGYSATGVMARANVVDRTFMAMDRTQHAPGREVVLPIRPFSDRNQLDRVLIRWDLSHPVTPDSFSYFAEEPGDDRHHWDDTGLDVDA